LGNIIITTVFLAGCVPLVSPRAQSIQRNVQIVQVNFFSKNYSRILCVYVC